MGSLENNLTPEQILNLAFDSTAGSLNIKGVFLTEFQDLGAQAIDKSDIWVSVDIGVGTKTEIIVSQKAVYNAEALLGTACQIYTALDSTNFDTDPYIVFGPDFNAGSTKQKTRRADIRGLGAIRLQTQNLDATFGVTAQITYGLIEE